jgi:ABC-type nitrate/sulfonate/bicarbonate transport system permease component
MKYVVHFMGRVVVILICIELLLSAVRAFSPVENPNTANLSLRSILKVSTSGGVGGRAGVFAVCGQGLAITARHAFGAAFLSVVFGLIIGLTGFSKGVQYVVAPIVDFFRAVPVTLMSVIAVMATGRASDWGLVALVCIPCTAMMASVLFKGIELDRQKPERAEIFRINNNIKRNQKSKLFLNYHIPARRPEIALGIKLVTSYAIVVACVLEMMGLGAPKSAGRIIGEVLDNTGCDVGGVPLLLIVALGLLAYISNCILDQLEKKYANQKY